VKECFERLLEEHRHSKQACALQMARSLLHSLLITVLREHEHYRQTILQKPLTTWRVRRTLQWMEARIYNSDESLDSLAKEIGLSPAGLRARFKQETGFTPHEYLQHRRIEEAQRRLAETADEVTTVAHELGFSSSQYFSTVFRRQTGLTPCEYRRRHTLV
jgi:AraC family transcriptional regulator